MNRSGVFMTGLPGKLFTDYSTANILCAHHPHLGKQKGSDRINGEVVMMLNWRANINSLPANTKGGMMI